MLKEKMDMEPETFGTADISDDQKNEIIVEIMIKIMPQIFEILYVREKNKLKIKKSGAKAFTFEE
jgi:hypothetical protein